MAKPAVVDIIRRNALLGAVGSLGALYVLVALWFFGRITLLEEHAINTYLYGDDPSACYPPRLGWGLPLTIAGRTSWVCAVLAVMSIGILAVLFVERSKRLDETSLHKRLLGIAIALRRYSRWIAVVSLGILVVLLVLWLSGAFTVFGEDYTNAVRFNLRVDDCETVRSGSGLPLTLWGKGLWASAALAVTSAALYGAFFLARLTKTQ